MTFKAIFVVDKTLWTRFKAKCKSEGTMASVKLREIIHQFLRGK